VTRGPALRRRSRRAALQALYAADVSARSGRPEAAADALAGVSAHFDLHENARAFADEIVRGVGANREALDARIAAHARNWRVERMAAVDRNVLRIAAWELVCTDTPASVVIDEAVDIARDFGSERSPAFVNGVLDAIARELRDERGAVPAEAKP
jgi:N utilization substance protein B